MIRKTLGATAVVVCLVPPFAFAEVGEANFSLLPTRDLYELCSAPSGSLSGNWGAGALIGAGAGAVGGYLVHQHKKGHID